jgi:hypothetical protein
MREAHDPLEEFGADRFRLGHRQGAEAFEIASDPVLFFHAKVCFHQTFQEVDTVDRGDKVIIVLGPVDA